MAYSKEKQQKLETSLTVMGALAGTNTISVAGGIKGLGMNLEQVKCDEQAKAVRDGLFKVAVMGTFSTGKSTVINALIGANILPVSVNPTTAILTFIQYGQDEEHVVVFMADSANPDGSVTVGECIQMTIENFQREYKYTHEDEIECVKTGTVSRFAAIKYAVMYCSKPLMHGGVTIVDSPGTEDKVIATELALKIAQKAQAVIYISPERGFADQDKEYINNTFKNCPNNVFFVINRFDLVPKGERAGVIAKAKMDVQNVFIREDGTFDENLCNHRLFGISAKRALESRTGLACDNETEEEEILTDVKKAERYELSFFEPFEKELEKFLTTDDKCVAQYQKCFDQMASTYRNAENQIAGYISIYENDIQMDAEKKEECAKIIADIESSIKLNETTFDNCSFKIQNAISDLLNDCSSKIDSSWNQDMMELARKVDVGTLSFMWNGLKQINPFATKESKEENMKRFTKPFIDVVTEYFVEKVNSHVNENRIVIDKVVEECQKTLDVRIANTEDLFKELSKNILEEKNVSVGSEKSNWLQTMISLYLGDFSAAMKGANDGKAPWMEFLKKTIFNTVWQAVLLSFIDGGIGVLIAIAIEYYQGKLNASESVKKILVKSKDGIVKVIKEETDKMRNQLNQKIAVEINSKKQKKCNDATQKLQDELTKLQAIEASYTDHNFNLDNEKLRFDKILSTMYNEAEAAYSVVFGRQLTLHQFKNF